MLLFVDNLSNVDFSYLHPKRGLLGETWLASTEMDGALDDQGMVCDFGIVKKTLREWLDKRLDHCLLVPKLSPHLKRLDIEGEEIALSWHYPGGEIECRSPAQAITLIDAEEISPESVAQWSVSRLMPLLPETLNELHLGFAPEILGDEAVYHYSHGLKKHAGNCQRIAHGHRSTIQIWKDGQRSPSLEQQWAKRWNDIYLGSRSDLKSEQNELYQFAYQSAQGAFELSIPQSHCEILDSDTTVEWISRYIHQQLCQAEPGRHFKVKAFEGIGKGAVYQG